MEEKNPGTAIDCKISNQTVARQCVEAGEKNRDSKAKINGRGGGQKNVSARRLLARTLVILGSPNKEAWRGYNKWSRNFLLPKIGLFLSI
jgi:hypothetical protein